MKINHHCRLYYEVHVTLDPVEGEARALVERLALPHGFRVAKFVMRKTGEFPEDTFCTARGKGDIGEVQARTVRFVKDLQAAGIKVRRYKIEDTIVDSNISDALDLLTRKEWK